MILAFASTLFLSAMLLFLVQPMVARILLPLLGGSPAVWNTCMVFFQAALLGGYLYAHLVSAKLTLRMQVWIHMMLLALAAWFLPLQVPASQLASLPSAGSPALWLLGCLLAMVGLPFFVLSSTAPLLQRWFSQSGHAHSKDPYFLYSASNLGSLLALLGYPLFLEPWLKLSFQTRFWTAAYAVLVLGLIGCSVLLWRRFKHHSASAQTAWSARAGASGLVETETDSQDNAEPIPPPTAAQRATWILLAFVPSSLMLGVTTFLTTDIASIPLMWVLPLSLYLLSFVMMFASKPLGSLAAWSRVLPWLTLGLVYLMLTRTTEPLWLILSLHLGFFFVAALVCHGRLAAGRPPARYLTGFYLWMSVGGVAGGVFNALLAPAVFRNVIEYPIAMVLACLLTLPRAEKWVAPAASARLRDVAFPLALGGVTLGLAWFLPHYGFQHRAEGRLLAAGLPAGLVFLCSGRPARFGLAVAAVLIGGWQLQAPAGATLFTARNFFGVSRVQFDPQDNVHRLIHGNTFHGNQFQDPERRCLPLAYFHPNGPCGDIMESLYQLHPNPRVAVIGLGSGSMAGYIRPGHHWTFYEIDPAVIRIAQDTNLFTFLSHCQQGRWDIVAGDARLKLHEASDGQFDLLVVDAFSSDAIPIHLITREAFALYRSKLKPGGFLACHISNRYLDLKPVLGAVARDLQWLCHFRQDEVVSPEARQAGQYPSLWAVLAEKPEDLGPLARLANWIPAVSPDEFRVWTDDYSNLLSVFDWK